MKKLICTLTLGAGLLLGLSGCDLYQPDVDSLLTPPVLSELQTEVDEALREVVGQELRLCYPAGGSYRSPYIFTDLDGDEEQEAVVFYTVEDEPLVYLQILDKSDGRWRARNALPGTEGEVLFVDFRHLSGDGATDLLVGWREPDREFDTLYLYRYRDAALSEEFHISCDGMAIADFDGDGYEELIAATVDGGVTLQYIGWSGAGISVLDSAYSSLRLQNILESVTGRIAQELLALCGAHTEPSSTGIGVENFVSSLPDAVQNAIAEVTGSAGLPPDRLTMEEKIRIVESLHHAGIFYMKGAVSEVAAQLGSSEATIYRYLSKLK